MTNIHSRTSGDSTGAPVTRLLDLLLSTAQNQRRALDLLQRHWKPTPTLAGAPRAQPERTARAERVPPDPPTRPIPTAEIGAQVLRSLQALAAAGRLRVNEPAGHLYIQGEHVAITVPATIRSIRSFLQTEGRRLPNYNRILDALREEHLAVANERGLVIKRFDIRVGNTWHATDVKAILLRRSLLDGIEAQAGFAEVAFAERPASVPAASAAAAPTSEAADTQPIAKSPADGRPITENDGYGVIRF